LGIPPVKARIKGVEVFAVQMILRDPQRFAEIINLSKAPQTLMDRGFVGHFKKRKIELRSPCF